MKLPKIKLPVLSVKQKALSYTFGIVVAIIFLFYMLVNYTVDTIAVIIVLAMIACAGCFIYSIYKAVLLMIEQNQRKRR